MDVQVTKILIKCSQRRRQGIEPDDEEQPHIKLDVKKVKTYRRKMKTKRAKSLYAPKKHGYQAQSSRSDKSEDFPTILTNSTRNNSPYRRRTTFIAQRATVTRRMISKVKSNPDAQVKNSPTKGITSTRRKVMRKKRTKRKTSTTPDPNPPGPSGIG